jgi:hypothetical protein
MNPLNLGGMLIGATFMIIGVYFFQTLDTVIFKMLSISMIGLGGYIIWLHYIQENYLVNI